MLDNRDTPPLSLTRACPLRLCPQEEPYRAFKSDKKEYETRVKAQVQILRQS